MNVTTRRLTPEEIGIRCHRSKNRNSHKLAEISQLELCKNSVGNN
jgi:hypothetical protein